MKNELVEPLFFLAGKVAMHKLCEIRRLQDSGQGLPSLLEVQLDGSTLLTHVVNDTFEFDAPTEDLSTIYQMAFSEVCVKFGDPFGFVNSDLETELSIIVSHEADDDDDDIDWGD